MPSDEKLIFLALIGEDKDGNYEYDAYVSTTPDTAWGEDWNENCPVACGNLKPSNDTYTRVIRYRSPFRLTCAQENTCFSMQDCIDGILALVYYEDDEGNFPFMFKFAEDMEDVDKIFTDYSIEKIGEETNDDGAF